MSSSVSPSVCLCMRGGRDGVANVISVKAHFLCLRHQLHVAREKNRLRQTCLCFMSYKFLEVSVQLVIAIDD